MYVLDWEGALRGPTHKRFPTVLDRGLHMPM